MCLNDGVVEGLRCLDVPAFTVQYHPEAAAGPHDADYLFDRFVELMRADARRANGSRRRGVALMPRRDDIAHVLVIGSGPIVIGQACEFDYSGTQACRVLRAEGLRVSLVNSNPATIMTDPEFADATYVEPITPEFVEQVIARERPDAVLATLGGQTALNTAVALARDRRAGQVRRRADRRRHRGDPPRRGPRSCSRRSCRTGRRRRAAQPGLPLDGRGARGRGRARPAGGASGRRSRWAALGSGMARTRERAATGSPAPGWPRSPVHEVLIEESVLGWKEFELELMRDRNDNVVVVCSIENVDPMGVHTGDSVTVAPAMTLTDREYQRDARPRHRGAARGRRGHRRLQHPVRGAPGHRPDGRHRDEPAGVPLVARWRPRRPASRSRRSRRSWRSATRSTRSPTTSPARRRPRSSRRSTTSW